jgi:hypothetical protein
MYLNVNVINPFALSLSKGLAIAKKVPDYALAVFP